MDRTGKSRERDAEISTSPIQRFALWIRQRGKRRNTTVKQEGGTNKGLVLDVKSGGDKDEKETGFNLFFGGFTLKAHAHIEKQ